MPKNELRSPKRNGRNLRVRLREVEPHSKESHRLSRGDSKIISEEIMLMQAPFLIPEVEVEVEGESSHVLHVENTDTKPWIVQTERWTEEKLTSQRR